MFLGRFALVLFAAAPLALTAPGCESEYKKTGGDPNAAAMRADLFHKEVELAIDRFKVEDPSLGKFFETARGYAVFPSIGKGGAGLGGAHGRGELFENGQVIGTTEMTQGTIGLQLGGQTFAQIIFFQNGAALEHFKSGRAEFSAEVSAVAARQGAAAKADYHQGVAVFQMIKGGLMGEASIGGQKFSYQPRR
jgi:lipid-binding SYLF domain-containing protein